MVAICQASVTGLGSPPYSLYSLRPPRNGHVMPDVADGTEAEMKSYGSQRTTRWYSWNPNSILIPKPMLFPIPPHSSPHSCLLHLINLGCQKRIFSTRYKHTKEGQMLASGKRGWLPLRSVPPIAMTPLWVDFIILRTRLLKRTLLFVSFR